MDKRVEDGHSGDYICHLAGVFDINIHPKYVLFAYGSDHNVIQCIVPCGQRLYTQIRIAVCFVCTHGKSY